MIPCAPHHRGERAVGDRRALMESATRSRQCAARPQRAGPPRPPACCEASGMATRCARRRTGQLRASHLSSVSRQEDFMNVGRFTMRLGYSVVGALAALCLGPSAASAQDHDNHTPTAQRQELTPYSEATGQCARQDGSRSHGAFQGRRGGQRGGVRSVVRLRQRIGLRRDGPALRQRCAAGRRRGRRRRSPRSCSTSRCRTAGCD